MDKQPLDGKRIFDIGVAALVLLVTSPFTIAAMIGIKLTSPGPVFYRAKRVGKDSVPYFMHKLRTMHVAKTSDGPVITGPNDPRIFKFGNLLRMTKIDELPQFIDVLLGQMSVVGPRPEDPDIVENYYSDAQKKTLLVKPGVTSPAALIYSVKADEQLANDDVVGSYVNNVLSQKLKIEQDYIDKASLGTDLQIVWQTFLFVLNVLFRYVSKTIGIKKNNP